MNYEDYHISVLRLDLLHPEISGNKWFKLKYNLLKAREAGETTILTFGGAFSNHIAATAAACKQEGFQSIGIIRGEEGSHNNITLSKATELGMQLIFVNRDEYRLRNETEYLLSLSRRFPETWIIPEGGNNALGEKGCQEILGAETDIYTRIFCAVGTGATFRGIANSIKTQQFLSGIHVLKYETVSDIPSSEILNDYHFGGYARHTQELLDFKSWFENCFAITLDYVYTSKLCYAVFDLIKQGKIRKEEKILIIHSGGLQGNTSYENRYNLNPRRQVNEPQG